MNMNLGVNVDKDDIKEIEEKILPTFVEHYADKVVSPIALMVALQGMINIIDEIKKELGDE